MSEDKNKMETEKKKNAVVGKLVIGVATLLGLAALYLAVKVLFD